MTKFVNLGTGWIHHTQIGDWSLCLVDKWIEKTSKRRESLTFFFKNFDEWYFLEINQVTAFFFCKSNVRSKSYLAMVSTGGVENWTESVTWIFVCFLPPTNWTLNSWWKLKKGKWKGMRESCLVYCYSGIQSLFEVVLLYTFYTGGESILLTKNTTVSYNRIFGINHLSMDHPWFPRDHKDHH